MNAYVVRKIDDVTVLACRRAMTACDANNLQCLALIAIMPAIIKTNTKLERPAHFRGSRLPLTALYIVVDVKPHQLDPFNSFATIHHRDQPTNKLLSSS